MPQKVAVVGVGAVGQACAFALMLRGSAREIVLVDRIAERAAAVATDMRYGVPLSPTAAIASGDWSDLAGASVVLTCAGVNEKSGSATDRADGQGRLRLLDTNAGIYRDIVPRIVAAAPDAELVAVTDPPDPLADLTRAPAGHDRVLSAGTDRHAALPSARRGGARRLPIRGRGPRDRRARHDRGHALDVAAHRRHAAGRGAQRPRSLDDSAGGSSETSASPTSRSSRATAPASSASGSPAPGSPRRSCATSASSCRWRPTASATA